MSQVGALKTARLRDSKARDLTTSPDGVRVPLDTADSRAHDLLGSILMELKAIRITLAQNSNIFVKPEDL